MNLPPFDESARCPKCGCEEISTTYHTESTWTAGCNDRCPGWRALGEHLGRDCRRCGHEWAEAVLERARA